jgi:UDP-N-acetylmuramate--alanine ligase
MHTPLTSPRIAVFFGGPSSEKDISLDSCRTFVDAVRGGIPDDNLRVFFLSETLTPYRISIDWLYSNTIGDFWPLFEDIKTAEDIKTSPSRGVLSPMPSIADCLRDVDAICCFVHGVFGEDGGLAEICEQANRSAYLGSKPAPLDLTFSKSKTHRWYVQHGYTAAKQIAVEASDAIDNIDISSLTETYASAQKEAAVVVKPARGGSSDGVSIVTARDLPHAIANAREFSSDVVIEELIQGLEFSVVAIQDIDDTVIVFEPTAVIPQVPVGATHDTPFYTRLQKYMPGSGAQHHTPLSENGGVAVPVELIEKIRMQAQKIFQQAELRDWARFDGFIRNAHDVNDNEIVWSEINGIPGYGVDGFLFQQAAIAGFSQRAISLLLLERCLNREGKSLAANALQSSPNRNLAVLGGGASSERAVSRMSWLNVIHKLSVSGNNRVARIFVGSPKNLDGQNRYFEVSAFISLQHTVEEIEELIADPSDYLRASNLWQRRGAAFSPWLRARIDTNNFAPRETSLEQLKNSVDFIFIALHGGFGEDGTLQAELDRLGIPYNGSAAAASKLCMNKNKTALALTSLDIPGFRAPIQTHVPVATITQELHGSGVDTHALTRVLNYVRAGKFSAARNDPAFATIRRTVQARAAAWAQLVKSPGGLVLKPAADGCSSGVLVTREPYNDLPIYLLAVLAGIEFIPRIELANGGAGKDNDFALRMPAEPMQELLLEENIPHHYGRSACIEMTVAVFGTRGEIISLLPSETPSDFSGLTVEEKFCKGIGRNLTPPPILTQQQIMSIRERIARYANAIGIEGYARIDVFYIPPKDELILIEVNSLPGLSMATVTFTQAAVTPEFKMRPSEFLEAVVELGEKRLVQRITA